MKTFKINSYYKSLQDFFNIREFISEEERANLLEVHYYVEHCYKMLKNSTFKSEIAYYRKMLPQAIELRDNLYWNYIDKYDLKGREVEFKCYK